MSLYYTFLGRLLTLAEIIEFFDNLSLDQIGELYPDMEPKLKEDIREYMKERIWEHLLNKE